MSKDIFFFIREEPYGFLSNFWRATQYVDNIPYDSNERYYQVQKAKDQELQIWIYHAPSPYLAMVVGHNLREGKEVRDNWTIDVRLETMLKGLRCKFYQNPDLANKLLQTGDAILHENNPKDTFWGYADGMGVDNLGKLLIQVREELKQHDSTVANKESVHGENKQ